MSQLPSLWTDPPPAASRRVSPVRRIAGWVATAAGAVALVGFVIGTANPWHNVALRLDLGNPFLGALLACALAVAATWLLWPVRSEATQSHRVVLRWTTIVLMVVSLIAYGLFGSAFAVSARTVAHSPSGTRTVGLETTGNGQDLRVWIGSGLGRRDIGSLGDPCGGSVQVRFVDENTVHVSTVYRERDLHLDSATGHPVDHLGPTCTD